MSEHSVSAGLLGAVAARRAGSFRHGRFAGGPAASAAGKRACIVRLFCARRLTPCFGTADALRVSMAGEGESAAAAANRGAVCKRVFGGQAGWLCGLLQRHEQVG